MKKKAETVKPENTVTGGVVNMRITDEAKKTRLVLYVTAKAPVTIHMSNRDKTLVINLRHFHWGGRDVWQSNRRKLITDGYIKNGKLYVHLKHPASFKALKLLSPSRNQNKYIDKIPENIKITGWLSTCSGKAGTSSRIKYT